MMLTDRLIAQCRTQLNVLKNAGENILEVAIQTLDLINAVAAVIESANEISLSEDDSLEMQEICQEKTQRIESLQAEWNTLTESYAELLVERISQDVKTRLAQLEESLAEVGIDIGIH